ncbi:MAG: SPOR domain-containing protein [Nitrospinae bacterium]|nr:SPOR domain-containing protein [Nitrospinota bacterium]
MTAAFFICLACFLIGVYLAKWEGDIEVNSSPPPETKRELPEKIIVETEENTPSPKASLKPEELTFFKTLLSNPEKEAQDEIPEAPPEKKSMNVPGMPEKKSTIIKETDIPEGAMVEERGQDKAPAEKSVPKAAPAPVEKAMPKAAKVEKAAAKEERATVKEVKIAAKVEDSGGKKYKIQVASFALEAEAARKKKELMDKGYSGIFVQPVELSGKGTWYRVYIGKYETYESAQKAENGLQSREKLSTLIVLERE